VAWSAPGAALASRDLIGQAEGILMATHRVSAVEAFDLLRPTSQDPNVKLRNVADHVSRSGDLP
jgi:AmiR/NasT family two-component response regulator